MTTDLPAGRDLDRAVATALGYPADMSEMLVRPFSTAFGEWTQEMLDWLSKPEDAGMGAIYHGQRWRSNPTRCDWRASIAENAGGAAVEKREPSYWFGVGDTIPEAIARLVVKVAQKEKR
jgi:hypothetical protein